MKKYTCLLSLFLIFINLSAFAQHNANALPFLSRPFNMNTTEINSQHQANSILKKRNNTTKKASGYIEKLDSIYIWDTINYSHWFPHANLKYVDLVYDANNNVTSEWLQTWNGWTWEKTNQYSMTYDANNNCTCMTTRSYNSAGVMLYLTKDTMAYDGHNNLIYQSYVNWKGVSWVRNNSYTWTYNAKNSQTSELICGSNAGNLVPSYLDTWTYDANNNLINELYQNYSSSGWLNSYEYVYTYDAHNNQTSSLYQYWNSGSWVNTGTDSVVYSYNSNNQIVSAIYINPNSVNDSTKHTYTYNSSNQVATDTYQTWNGTSWANSSKETSIYNSSGNEVLDLTQNWQIGFNWVSSNRVSISYDVNNNPISYLVQSWTGYNWLTNQQIDETYDVNSQIISYERKAYEEDTIPYNADSIHYYFHDVSGVNNLTATNTYLNIYPNPNNGVFNIAIKNYSPGIKDDIEIYDMLGEVIYTTRLNKATTQIDLSNNSSGIYLYRVITETGQFISEGKFIKQ